MLQPSPIRPSSIIRSAALLMLAVTCVMVSMNGAGAAASTKLKAPYVRAGTRLTDTTLGAATTFGDVDMLNSSLGYAVAAPVNHGRGWFYLIRTTDLGDRWNVRAALPVHSFVGPYGWGDAPTIDFLSAEVGYLSLGDGALLVSNDGGLTWTKVDTPGTEESFALAGRTMSVVSDVCPTRRSAVWRCPSDLSQYAVGATRAFRTAIIPALGVGPWRAGYILASPIPSTVIVVEGRGMQRSSLLETTNAGASWSRLSDPCEQLNINQLLVEKGGRWLLSCFQGGGMNQGDSELWDSFDGGGSWSIEAHASEGGASVGGIGDVSNTLYQGGSGILFAALGGAAGGVEYSSDGGRQWRLANLALNIYGGAPELMSTFGATGAVVSAQNVASFVTRDAKTWRQLPELPAGTFEGLRVCAPKATKAVLGRRVTGVPASTLNFAVTFTNEGRVACYLNGIPAVQTVWGASRTPIGRASYQQTANKRGGFVVLRAKGGKASIALAIESVRTFPRSTCRSHDVDGVIVRFNSPATFHLSTPRWSVCRSYVSTGIEGITAGTINWR
jgi:hypothetical protein